MLQKMLYDAGRAIVNRYMKLTLDVNVQWDAPLPDGPKIMAANHPTTTDPFYIMSLLKEQMHILVTEGAFDIPLFGRYLHWAGHIPVMRSHGAAALESAAAYLRQGHTVTIFPEGALSPVAGGVGRPCTGTVRLALMTGVPVIPVGIHLRPELKKVISVCVNGQDTVGIFYPRGPYAITVGTAMTFQGDPENREAVRKSSERLIQRIALLSQASAVRLTAPEMAPLPTGLV